MEDCDFACGQTGWLVSTKLVNVLANLLKVPEEKRGEFYQHVVGLHDFVNPPDGLLTNSVRKGNAALEKAEYHARNLIDALKAVANADGPLVAHAYEVCLPGPLRFESGGFVAEDDLVIRHHDPTYKPASLGDILAPLAEALAHLVGRDPQEPKAKDWRLNSILRDVRTWPDRFGAVGITDHRSATLAKAVGLLREIMPDIIPDSVSPSTIRDIWNPRPRKRNVRTVTPIGRGA